MLRIGISYGRFSGGLNQKKGRSFERQVRRAGRFARKNKLTLDESLSAFDEGLSAYWGDHAMKGELARFLALCGTPCVPVGSVLIIEDFDRLSRQLPDDAWELFRQILMTGVEIAVLSLGKWFTKASLNSFEDRVIVQASQHRAHEESRLKAERLRDVWKARRKRARAGNFRPTNLPSWCRWQKVDGTRKIAVIPERGAALLRIVELYEAGDGVETVAAMLNRDPGFPCWLKGNEWSGGNVYGLLTSPQIWGGYQPKKYSVGRKVVNVGDAIAGCYPAIIERERALTILATLRARKVIRGRAPKDDRGTLRRLVFDVMTGKGCTLRNGGRKKKRAATVYLARPTAHGRVLVIGYSVLEDLVLRIVQKWTPDALRPVQVDASPDQSREFEAKLRDIDERRQAMKEALNTARASGIAALVASIDALDLEEAEVNCNMSAAEARRVPSALVLESCQSLIRQLWEAPPEKQGEIRTTLNRRLRDLLSGVWLHRQELGDRKAAVYVQVWSRSGQSAYAVAVIGKPPEGFAPLDLTPADRDFRTWRGR